MINGSALVQPYLFFQGRCEEAIEFYKDAVGARVQMVMRYREAPEAPPPGTLPPGWESKIMHASFQVGESLIMASDGICPDGTIDGFALSIAFANTDDVDRAFAALSPGGEIAMPLGPTFWSPKFGMLHDKFGVHWMVTVIGPAHQ